MSIRNPKKSANLWKQWDWYQKSISITTKFTTFQQRSVLWLPLTSYSPVHMHYKIVLTEPNPLPTPKFQTKEIWDFDLDPARSGCRPDLSPKMLWIVGISHFAKFHKNQMVTVWEMIINVIKSPILQQWGKFIRNLYLGPEPHQRLPSSSDW